MQIFADRFMSSGHPAATSTPSKGGSSKDVLNRLRGMPNMKQVLQGRDTINKVLEEVPHLKAGYHGLVTISLINLLIRTLAFSFKMPSVHAADYFQVVDNFGCPEGLMRAVEQSAGGKLFHHVVESDKVAAGILKEVNRIKLPGGFTLPNKIDSFRPMQRPAVGN